jgi:hypothetical protein
MAELSKEAQAVLSACAKYPLHGDRIAETLMHGALPAALRAAADHIDHDWSAFNCIDSLYEIAAELEGLHG